MTAPAIRVEKLSKQYQLGGPQGVYQYRTLREAVTDAALAPVRRLKGLDRARAAAPAVWALKDVDFEIQPGEVVGIIGRNGAGKSTLLKVLSRITEPTSGRAVIHGRIASLLEVGTGFHPELSGRENVYLNGAILGMSRREIEGKFDDIVQFAEVEQFVDTAVKRYSSGMYLRLAFAVAAHLEPEILVVDEVLAVGDASFQDKCMGKMGEVAHQGRTVLFVSHNMSSITALCGRALWMHQGQVAGDGEPLKIVHRYLESVFSQTKAAEGFTSLEERKDRKGDGRMRLTHVRLLDARGNPVPYFESGQEVQFAIGYRSKKESILDSVTIGFTLLNERQQFISYCQNDVAQGAFRGIEPSGEFRCRIPKLPLMPGRYTLSIACKSGVVAADGVYNACEFEVVEGEFFPTRLLPTPGYGDVLFEQDWTVQSGALIPQEALA
jgi:lipopolysaccharide transport system ATP-binding protein